MNWKVWFESTKPKVYTASIGPVIIGTALAASRGTWNLELGTWCLICAILIQLTSNWSNDLYDFKSGADTKKRVGPRRVLVEGLISYKQLRNATWIAAVVCFALGMIIVAERGWIVFAIGVASLFGAWMYTGGPFSFAYHGLGEAAAFFFFGILGVNGTYFVHTGTIDANTFVVSCSVGLLVANILLVNNIRDREQDRGVGKTTLAVIIGDKASRMLYMVFTIVAIMLPSLWSIRDGFGMQQLPLLTMPLAIPLFRIVFKETGPTLNKALVGSGVLLLCFVLLISLALFM